MANRAKVYIHYYESFLFQYYFLLYFFFCYEHFCCKFGEYSK
ncbi:hypothetical protein BGX16_2145 [Hallerella succinigenes]|uniref:Uncharacterized protein n=1 Tax=Hallerella succinigenes TaxID=1896222 RepID=A0A2M9A8W7_9BACT|nr:hypothetical protein BGX16_2145 [Hallerella succinigenes]